MAVVLALGTGVAPAAPGQATTPAVSSTSFRASGNEPGWTLDIGAGQLTLLTDDGKTRIEATLPAGLEHRPASRGYVGRTSDGRTLAVTLVDGVCADTMTGMPRPVTVEVVVEGRTLKGCGGDPATLLRGRTWVVEDINGRGVLGRVRVTLVFGQGGRLSGTASCNPFRTTYLLTGEALTFTMPIGGMRECSKAQMVEESVFLDVLRGVQRFEISPVGALVLHSAEGGRITARAEDPLQAALAEEAKKKK